VAEAVSTVLHCIAFTSCQAAAQPSPLLACFDEGLYSSPPARAGQAHAAPDFEAVGLFVKQCLRVSFKNEAVIIALILVNRLVNVASKPLRIDAGNFRLLFLTSLVVADKMWSEQCVPAAVVRCALHGQSFCVAAAAFNEMEVRFLTLLDYDVHVTPTLYTTFSIELASLVVPLNNEPMPHAVARDLRKSMSCNDVLCDDKVLPSPAGRRSKCSLAL